MPGVDTSTISLLKDWEGVRYKAYLDSTGYSIGVGHFITPKSEKYDGVELLTGTLTNDQVNNLLNQDLNATNISKGRGYATLVQSQITAPLNQDQFNALVLFTYNLGSLKDLRTVINKYGNDLNNHKEEISEVWKQYIYSKNRFTGTKTVNPELVVRRQAEIDLFFGDYLGSASVYRKQKGQLSSTSPSSNNIEGNDNTPLSSSTDLNNDFRQILQNIQGLEEDNNESGVIWGQRNNILESFDWIGLKQYLLYLCTTYYPDALVPFIELIPKFFTDAPYSATGNDTLTEKESVQNNSFSNPIGVDRRFVENAIRQNSLTEGQGIDLFTIDPFQETTNSLNNLNEEGKEFYNKRGFGYKIFGMISLTPSVQGVETSKAGAVGFTSIEIEGGSQVNNNMSLITIEMLDVQGNKFLDINSPWSFILNSRPNTVSADFYFRYGWQVRIPTVNPKTNKEDINGWKFWNHPGWALFDTKNGENIKDYIFSIAKTCDYTITLTQSSNPSSFQTPGYRINQTTGFFEIDQQTRKLGFENYLTLTLRNPEIKVNPQDGSITGTLYFMNVSTVANCLCPLSKAKNMWNLVQSLKGGTTNLLTFMAYFFADNNQYLKQPITNKKYNIDNNSIINVKKTKTSDSKNNSITTIDPESIYNYISVIGSVPKSDDKETSSTQQNNNFYPLLDPKSIPIKIKNKKAAILNKIINTNDNPETLIGWLNSVFEDNYLTSLSAVGQVTSGSDLTNNFIIAYEYDKAKQDPVRNSQIRPFSNLSKDDYTSRLSIQDDVFSFRFRGSLVESLSIEKLDTPSQFSIQVESQLSKQILQDPNDINNKKVNNIAELNEKDNTSNFPALPTFSGPYSTLSPTQASQVLNNDNSGQVIYYTDEAVTYTNKREYLAMLYSTMMGCNIRCIAHPWIKIGLPVGIKGTGFFDGAYLVTKVKHSMSSDNKFISEISGCRIINQNEFQKQQDNLQKAQELAQNKPNMKLAENALLNQKISPIDKTFVKKPDVILPQVIQQQQQEQLQQQINESKYNQTLSQNNAFSKNIKFVAQNEYENYSLSSNEMNLLQIQKYQNFTNNIDENSFLMNNWSFDFINWVIKKASNQFDIFTSSNPLDKNLFPSTAISCEDIYNAFLSAGHIITNISNLVDKSSSDNTYSILNYTSPKDLTFMFWENGGRLGDNTIHEPNYFIGIIVDWAENSSEIINNKDYGIFQVVIGDYINTTESNTNKNTQGILERINLQLDTPSTPNINSNFGTFLGFGVV